MHLFLAILHTLGITQKKLATIRPEEAEEYFCHLTTERLLHSGYTLDMATRIVDKKTHFSVEDVESTIKKLHIDVIHKHDPAYPELLATLPDAPTILYLRGTLSQIPLLSVVGSRKHSPYAQSSLEKILPDIIRAGYGIVSGGAYGIDSIAHEIALKNNGYTLAVLGTGVDISYPISHKHMFEDIVHKGGGLLSHFPLGTKAEPYNFPMRNALVAGISPGVLIAEAGEDSGTLITARLALEANRDVFVIPADITRIGARGSNHLIRDGLGKLVTEAADILSEYAINYVPASPQTPIFSHELEENIYYTLEEGARTFDELLQLTHSEQPALLQALMSLELAGFIQVQQGRYML